MSISYFTIFNLPELNVRKYVKEVIESEEGRVGLIDSTVLAETVYEAVEAQPRGERGGWLYGMGLDEFLG
jgi:hypothetical protein